ncbi:hypothetical protein NPIL_648281 [Nephila pilipes]|uniref:Uncharacterized protein n=1 Tax=Nephila pilipes TaxID=299642 RepID=A0A8X6PID9_NEPPI|nr:hypothetical protein NPIL_648281 [Nephila pilipes]
MHEEANCRWGNLLILCLEKELHEDLPKMAICIRWERVASRGLRPKADAADTVCAMEENLMRRKMRLMGPAGVDADSLRSGWDR